MALLRPLINGARGAFGAMIVYPVAERIEGRDVDTPLRAFEAEMALPFAARRQHSWNAVVATVRAAAANVPYYADLFARIGFDPDKLAGDPCYLQDIPYLTKDIIRAEGERLLHRDHAQRRKFMAKTGGSTGPSAHIVYDQAAADYASAVVRSRLRGIGLTRLRAELHFASKFPDTFPLRDRLREQAKCVAMNRYNIFFASFDADELDRIWREIVRLRPYLVHGHPSTLWQLALHLERAGIEQRVFNVFESSGEWLQDEQRDTIARVFGCDVVDRYGLAEAGVVAYQAGLADRTMRVLDPVAWPEIADMEGDVGELVLTATKNDMMPLIRYRTGDRAELSETADGFVLDRLVGRIHDVVAIGGHRLPTHYIQDLLDRVGGIRQFQIEPRDARPLLRLVLEDGADPQALQARIAHYFHDAVDVAFIAPSDLRRLGGRQKFRHLLPSAAASEPPP
jgi:phenylacetate-CoA ligase